MLARLLAGPGDEEDVVVDAERDQEQERQERHAGVHRVEAEDAAEEPPRGAHAGGVRRDHGGDEQQRGDDGAQQQEQRAQHQQEDQRQDQQPVLGGVVLGVERLGVAAADVGVVEVGDGRADVDHDRLRGVAAGVGVGYGVDARDAVDRWS